MNDLLGKMIVARDGERFIVVSFPNGEKGLVNLDNCQVIKVDDVTDYIDHYHFGIHDIVGSYEIKR